MEPDRLQQTAARRLEPCERVAQLGRVRNRVPGELTPTPLEMSID